MVLTSACWLDTEKSWVAGVTLCWLSMVAVACCCAAVRLGWSRADSKIIDTLARLAVVANLTA